MMTELLQPPRDAVEGVYMILDVEVVRYPRTRRDDRQTLVDVMRTVTDATGEQVDGYVDLVAQPSDYDSGLTVYAGKWAGMLTVDQWFAFADAHGLDIPDGGIIPDDAEPTMGSLTEHGLLPAVGIPHLGEGWGCYWHEPDVIVSCYVSVLVRETGTAGG